MSVIDEFPLKLAKKRLTFLRKDIGDGLIPLPLDLVVAVEQMETQFVGNGTAHGGFPRAHESHQIKIYVRRVHQRRSTKRTARRKANVKFAAAASPFRPHEARGRSKIAL